MRVLVFVAALLVLCPTAARAQVRASFIVGHTDISAIVQAQERESSTEVTLAAPARVHARRPGFVTAFLPTLSSAFDLGSTILLSRRGGHETNPVLGQSIPRISATKAALTGVLVYALHRSEPQHPRATKIVAVVAIGAFGTAAIKNLHALYR